MASNHVEIRYIFKNIYEKLCAIWNHLCNFKNVKNNHVGVILLVKLRFQFAGITRRRKKIRLMFFKLSFPPYNLSFSGYAKVFEKLTFPTP